MANWPIHYTVCKLHSGSPRQVKKQTHWMGCPWGRSSSIPGRALELWTPAYATARLRRSPCCWASNQSLYRLIPGQSSEAAAWALIHWKPIKYTWAYFGSGVERGSHSQSRAGHCGSPWVSSRLQASLPFLILCKNWRQMQGQNFL